MSNAQACKLKFRLRELTSCLCSADASAVYSVGPMAGLDTTKLEMSPHNLNLSLLAC